MNSASTGPVVDAGDDRDDPVPPVDVERWARLAEAALATEQVQGHLTLTFVDEDTIAALNAEHMGKEGPTDVLSFPIDGVDGEVGEGVPRLLGDVVVCPAVASRQAPEHAGSTDDELALLVVHGILHVLGHDHAEPEETARMRERELVLLTEHHWGGPAPAGFRQAHD